MHKKTLSKPKGKTEDQKIDHMLNYLKLSSLIGVTADRFIRSKKELSNCRKLLKRTAQEIEMRILPTLKLSGAFDPNPYLFLTDSLRQLTLALKKHDLEKTNKAVTLMFSSGRPKNNFNRTAVKYLVNYNLSKFKKPNYESVANKMEALTGSIYDSDQIKKIYLRGQNK